MNMTFLVKQAYWCISQISGERLQDQWSSGDKFDLGHLQSFVVPSQNYLSCCVGRKERTPPPY